MNLKHLVSAQQLDKPLLNKIFALTDRIKADNYKKDLAKGKIMATLFYQPSTRTRLSFESAMIKLGGAVIATENADEFSSAIKGETLEDTIRIVNFYSDIIVIRHPQSGAAHLASKYSRVPVINAGDGIGEHPTQALLDLYTIFSKLKDRTFTITISGDHAHYRPTHSLSYLLSLYPKIKIIYVSPKKLAIPKSLKNHLKAKKIEFVETEDFYEGISSADIIYQTRIPKEYLGQDFKRYDGKYILDGKALKTVRKNAFIMHPLPRLNEISTEIDSDRRAIYFEQAQNGLFTRMALITIIFDNGNQHTS